MVSIYPHCDNHGTDLVDVKLSKDYVGDFMQDGDLVLVNSIRDLHQRIAGIMPLHERMPHEPLGCIILFFFKVLFIKHGHRCEDLVSKMFLV